MFSSREHAIQLLNYFRRMFAEHGDDEAREGSQCANEWLELIDAESPSPERLSALLARVNDRKDVGSGWIDLQLGLNAWASRSGFRT